MKWIRQNADRLVRTTELLIRKGDFSRAITILQSAIDEQSQWYADQAALSCQPKRTPIADLDLPPRIYELLSLHDVVYVGDITPHIIATIASSPNTGTKTIDYILEHLTERMCHDNKRNARCTNSPI